MPALADFEDITRRHAPRAAVVLGSGLGSAATDFREVASVAFTDIPGLPPPSVHGHGGRMAVGRWGSIPTLLFLGRLHYYEGHSRETVAGLVRVAADLGVKRLILTNAAGGIHPHLGPGTLMAIRGHLKLIGADAWRALAVRNALATLYSPHLLALVPDVFAGVYAALTGPCYETPAEIRALAASGADAVGMSTALEAEAAVERGMEVAAISCITNKAAGLASGTLNHAEVLANAKLAEERLRELVTRLVAH